MRNIKTVLLAFVLAFSLVGGSTGCATKIAQEENYKGDTTLYTVDKTIDEAYTLLATFLKWERTNRATINNPAVKKYADSLRRDAQQHFQSAIALRDVYAAAPTGENKNALDGSLRVLTGLLSEISKHMATTTDKKK